MAERPDIKFCGLTRPADAELAASLGARYVGVILVGGPRLVTPARASLVFDAARGPERVAVVSLGAPADMAALGHAAGADILQLHADPTPELVRALREHWKGGIWAAVRLGGGRVPSVWSQLFGVADAVVTDTAVPSGLGGSGVRFDWAAHRALVEKSRVGGRFVLAGGLTPGNIPDAIRVLGPDVVDVSSGVEDMPGVKSPELMRAFSRAVASSSPTLQA